MNKNALKAKIIRLFKQKNITGSAKDVLMVLTGYASKNGSAWPSNETLAERTGWSLRTIVRAIQQGVEAGILTVQRRMHRLGNYLVRKSNLYRFIADAPDTAEPGERLRDRPARRQLNLVRLWDNLSDNVAFLGKKDIFPQKNQPQAPQMSREQMIAYCLSV